MRHFAPPKVLILASRPADAARLAAALAPSAAAVWVSETELPTDQRAEVIVTDLAADEVARRAKVSFGTVEDPAGVPRADVGIVSLAAAPWADVPLPGDASAAELALACRLTAEIARLRAQRDELERVRDEATQLAQTDPLTGLANRRAWEAQFEARLALSHGPLWLAVVDLDGFKQVNDRLGMARGDEVLVRAAQALAGQLRREDFVARLGGDEFGVLLHDVAESHTAAIFDRLGAAVAEQSAPDGLPKITASIGYVSSGNSTMDAHTLFAAAERAMREAKRAGGNRALRG
jgi:diguanylate cyclase (GGDEF)-like protein